MSWFVPSYAGFILRWVLELKCKGKRCTTQPRRRWFSPLVDDKEREKMARNHKIKNFWRLAHIKFHGLGAIGDYFKHILRNFLHTVISM
jgi:hypothetical protein